MRARWFAAALTAAAIATAGLPAVATVGSAGDVVRISPTGDSTLASGVRALTGDADLVIYQRADAELLGTKRSRQQSEGVYSHLPQQLVAQSAEGDTVALGVAPPASRFWSMAGNLVTAEHLRPGNAHRPVLWWDVASGQHGSIEVPEGFFYSSAAPDGAVITDPATGELKELHRNGSVTSLGTGAANFLPTTVSSDSGFVNWNGSGSVTYQTWSSPGTFVDLQSGLGPAPNQPACQAMSDTYVACAESGQVSLVRLDGGAPVISASASDDDTGVGIIGTSLAYRNYDHYLVVVHGDGSDDTTSTTQVGDIVQALGAPVTEVHDKHAQISAINADAQFSSVTRVVPSQIVAGAFALTAHQIRWIDDAPTPGRSHVIGSVKGRGLTVHGGRVRLQRPRRVAVLAGGLHPGDPNTIVADGAVTVFQQRSGHVEAVTPHGARHFHGSLAVADRRWVVTRTERFASVHDLRTRRTIKIPITDYDALALWHNDLAHLSQYGKLTVTNLVTGHQRLVHPRVSFPHHAFYGGGPVYLRGGRVAWEGQGRGGPRWHLVSLKTGHRTTPAHAVIAMTADGVLEDLRYSPPGDWRRQPNPTPIWFQADGGRPRQLYAARRWWQLPEVAGHVIAWIDEAGQLKAQRFR
jgi:hypothetical protein